MVKTSSRNENSSYTVKYHKTIVMEVVLKPCSNKQCRQHAIWGADTCWQHLADPAGWRKKLVAFADRESIPQGSNFTECDLSNIYIERLDAQKCDFTGVNFDNTILRSSKLKGSILRRCSANNTDLSDSNLSETTSTGFSGIRIIATNTNFNNSCFKFASLPEANLDRSILTGSDWERSDLSYSILTNTQCIDWFAPFINLNNSNLTASDFRFAVMGGANLTDAVASDSNFQRANLCGIKGRKSSFSGSDLYYVRFNAANLDLANLSNSKITRTIFRTASLIGANLTGSTKETAIWDRTRFSLTD